MSKRMFFLIFVLLLLTFANPVAISGKASPRNAVSPRAPGGGLVMNTLQQIYKAQHRYYATVGKGHFGSLEELGKAGLIDPALASGFKYGFRFQLILYEPTETHPAAFTAAALHSKFFYRQGYIIRNTSDVIEIIGSDFREVCRNNQQKTDYLRVQQNVEFIRPIGF